MPSQPFVLLVLATCFATFDARRVRKANGGDQNDFHTPKEIRFKALKPEVCTDNAWQEITRPPRQHVLRKSSDGEHVYVMCDYADWDLRKVSCSQEECGGLDWCYVQPKCGGLRFGACKREAVDALPCWGPEEKAVAMSYMNVEKYDPSEHLVSPSCALIAKSVIVAHLLPIPLTGPVSVGIFGLCCPGEVVKKVKELSSKVTEWRKSDVQKIYEESLTIADENGEQAAERHREAIQEEYDSKETSEEKKRSLEEENRWLLYPQMVELYRFWELPFPSEPCEKMIEAALINMREEFEFLPGLEGPRMVDGSEESMLPEQLAVAPSELAITAESMKVQGNIVSRAHETMCKGVASGLDWALEKAKNKFVSKKTMEEEKAESLRLEICR